MRKLLKADLAEYWTLDIAKEKLNAYQEASGQIIQSGYGPRAKVPLGRPKTLPRGSADLTGSDTQDDVVWDFCIQSLPGV